MAEIYSKIPGLRINCISVFIYFFLNANKKTDQQRMNSPKRPIITCAPLERLTRSYVFQVARNCFFSRPLSYMSPRPRTTTTTKYFISLIEVYKGALAAVFLRLQYTFKRLPSPTHTKISFENTPAVLKRSTHSPHCNIITKVY